VASLLCIRHVISHDSQAAMELEAVGTDSDIPVLPVYPHEITPVSPRGENGEEWIIDMIPGIPEMVTDIQAGIPAGQISQRFHHTLVQGFSRTAQRIAAAHRINKVVLSGGVFQNDLMLNGVIACLKAVDLRVYTHTQVPAGDGGVSLGQAAVAKALWERHQHNGFKKNDIPAKETVSWV
jgi:hydrogenase maturation protein HypF